MTEPLTTKAAEIRAGLVAELRAACAGHPNASIAWPHRVLHQAAALIEQQAAELAEARAELAAQIAGHRLSAAHATRHLIERDGVKRPGVVLLDALRRYGFPMSEAAWRNTGDDAPVNAQASVEARALHRAAVAFFQAISGAAHAG